MENQATYSRLFAPAQAINRSRLLLIASAVATFVLLNPWFVDLALAAGGTDGDGRG